jgi:predicted RND superfamily exporter protein
MRNKFLIIFLYALSILGLFFSDDLVQNNESSQLLASHHIDKSEKKDWIILNFERVQDYEAEVKETLEKNNLHVQVISYKNMTKQDNIVFAKNFYQKYPELPLKLIQEGSISYLVGLDLAEKKNFTNFYQNLEAKFPSIKIAGLSYLNYKIGEETLKIKTIILPALISISFLLILLIFKDFYLTLIAFLFPFMGISLTQVLIKVIYGESNLLSSLSPLIIFVVLLCICFHVIFSMRAFPEIKSLIEHKARPILFMLVTTVLGIASLTVSTVPAIRSFSLITSLSLLVTSIITLLFLYLFLKEKRVKPFRIRFQKNAPAFNLKILTLITALPFLLFFLSFQNIKIEAEALFFFPKNSQAIKNYRFIEKNILGTPVLKISFDNFKQANVFEKKASLILLEKEIATLFGEKAKIISEVELIKNANYLYSGKRVFPDSKILYEGLKAQIPNSLIELDAQKNYELIVFDQAQESHQYLEQLSKVEKLLLTFGEKFSLRGDYYQLMKSQNDIIDTLFQSFLISLLLISVLIGFYFRSLYQFILFIIINIAPPILTLAIFSIFGLSLNLATVMTFSISFGLIVDSTIHVIYADAQNLSEKQKILSVYEPMIFSSIILIMGFSSFMIHNFVPIWQFGLGLVLTIFGGFLFDFFVLPSFSQYKITK